MKSAIGTMFGLLLLADVAAADTPYLDDRSDAAQLVRSLYNAVNRHEYARAHDYFISPPAKSFDAYVKGYEDTDRVDVLTGTVTAEGAAGSTFYRVPTAIRAKDLDGNTRYFAGCYTVRSVNGAVQDPPNRPLQIDSAKLKPAEAGDYSHLSLPDCGDGAEVAETTTPDETALLALAKDRFVRDTAPDCDKAADTLGGANDPQVYRISYRPVYAGDGEADSVVTLLAFSCAMAAYNSSEAYYIHEPVRGLRRLTFAAPDLDIAYEDGEDRRLKSMTAVGMVTDDLLTNSEFDPATRSISHFAKWRGVGDASTSATYVFSDGQFVLKDYVVDPTTDEQMNPWTIIRDGKVLAEPEPVPGDE